ncbi:hypothetical protein ACN38_g8631 [Penicillium nordicum]|uniref:Uncharacterized protein n=1 Tax=Penicillium nordicum TaxID=229535 RepID=A0A0N0RY93_9EURO|nr:hypothetical protein ACN38_g8631 [Penicillium nordicum]
MLKPEKVKQINEREEEREERDYAEGKRLLFFCPGKSRLTGGRQFTNKRENREFPFPSLCMLLYLQVNS